MRSKTFLCAGLALLCLLAAACQPLPQPFQPNSTTKASNPLLRLSDRSGIVVRPVRGMHDAAAHMLAAEMADALVRRNLPSFTESGNRESYVLTGEAVAVNRRADRAEVRLIWRLSDAAGTQIGEHVLDLATRPSAWQNDSPTLMRDLASKSAGAVAAMVQDPAPVDRLADRKQRTINVRPISGAPETAAALLRAETEAALRRQNLRVSSEMQADSIVILGTVDTSRDRPGLRRLTLEWTVMRPDGAELGNLKQTNSVTPDSLENEWPAIARAIAGGAAEGIRGLLDKVPEQAVR